MSTSVYFIESVLTISILVWFSFASSICKTRLQRVVEKIIGCELTKTKDLYIIRAKRRAGKLLLTPNIQATTFFVKLLLQRSPPELHATRCYLVTYPLQSIATLTELPQHFLHCSLHTLTPYVSCPMSCLCVIINAVAMSIVFVCPIYNFVSTALQHSLFVAIKTVLIYS